MLIKKNLTNVLKFNCKFLRLRQYYIIKEMSSNTKWNLEKSKILNQTIEQRRKSYRSSDYITLDKIDPWSKYVLQNTNVASKKPTLDDLNEFKKITWEATLNNTLCEKVSIFKGDITKLEIDAIVNAANSMLRAGGGVDGAIHRAAGKLLQEECNSLGGCPTGQAKVTSGYDLPAKYVIHTVGPQDGSASQLQSCYEKCLAYQQDLHLKSIAFPCISTGIYGFPNRLASHIALRAARQFLEFNKDVDRIIFCTFMPIDVEIYETLMQLYFPLHQHNYNDGASVTE